MSITIKDKTETRDKESPKEFPKRIKDLPPRRCFRADVSGARRLFICTHAFDGIAIEIPSCLVWPRETIIRNCEPVDLTITVTTPKEKE